LVLVIGANTVTSINDANSATPFTKDEELYSSTGTMVTAVFSRIYQEGDPTSFRFTISGVNRFSGIMFAVENAPSEIYDVPPVIIFTGAITPPVPVAAIVTLEPDTIDVIGICWDAAAAVAGAVTPADFVLLAANTAGQEVALWQRPLDAAGGTGAATIDYTGGGPFSTMSIRFALGPARLEPPPGIVTVIPPQSDEVGVAIAPLNSAGYFSGTVLSYTALNLPSGLTIDTSSGVITGTPDTVNTYSTTVVATNAGGPTNNGPFSWDIVGVAPVWTTVPDQISIEGSGVSVNFAPYVIDGSPPITFTASGGNPLPTGLVISSAGQVTGVPTVVGVFPVVLVATNSFGAVNSSAFNWTINSAAPDAPILDLPNAANFTESAGPETWDLSSYNIGAPATSWSTSGGPPGTTIDNAGVMTTDLTTAQGVWAVFVTAANAMGSYSDTLALNVTSSDPVVAQQPPVRFNTIGDSANVNMAAYISGATSWSATGLPTGTSINPTSGLITGTIGGTPQTYNPVITGTNIHGFITTTFQWTVQPVPVVGNKRYGRV
jgi:hypothetical protein